MANKVSKTVKSAGASETKKTSELPETSEMSQAGDVKQKNIKGSLRKASVIILLTIAIFIFGGVALFTTLAVVANRSSLRASRAEYDQLREIASETESDGYELMHFSALDEEMRQINPDYVGWLRIDGTEVNYPIVRGYDNEKYLKTSFYGESSITGAVFMDYRNVGNFLAHNAEDSLPHIIIYGHNLQQGGMFSDLRRLLNRQFLEENNIITLIIDDQPIEFEIFSARLTDVNDPAYFLNFSAPRAFTRFADKIDAPLVATQIITLSTCVRGGSDDSRLIIQGYRLI
jgi:sortase B